MGRALAVIPVLALLLGLPARPGPQLSPATAATSATNPPQAVTYQPPVAGPVVAGFVAPAHPYGPGHRGLEFATAAGSLVGAAAAGTVTFAGPVAGALHVTIQHADRLRSTYAFLATVVVRAGDAVVAGQVLGTTGTTMLWTARLGAGAYLDPAVLLAASGVPAVHLVPLTGGPTRPSTPTSAPTSASSLAPSPGPVSPAVVRWALE